MSFSDFTTDNDLLAKRLKEVDDSVKSRPNEMDADGGFGRAFSEKGRGRRYFAEQSKD